MQILSLSEYYNAVMTVCPLSTTIRSIKIINRFLPCPKARAVVANAVITVVQYNIGVTTNFILLKKFSLKVWKSCEIMGLLQNLNLITRILKQIVRLRYILGKILSFNI